MRVVEVGMVAPYALSYAPRHRSRRRSTFPFDRSANACCSPGSGASILLCANYKSIAVIPIIDTVMRNIRPIAPFVRATLVVALQVAVLAFVPRVATAQHGAAQAPPATVAPKEGNQFDFLVGQWELKVTPRATTLAQRIHGVGKFAGSWKAWRALDGWGIEDEVRITDGSGNPRQLSHAVRFFDIANRRWSISGVDVYRGVTSSSVSEWKNGEMIVSGQGADTDGRTYTSRATFSSITPASFTYRLDRSFDGGKSWTEGVTRIDAKRVAAAAPR